MKKIGINQKLSLNKKTISNLTDERMNKVKGGTPEPTKKYPVCEQTSRYYMACDALMEDPRI